MTMPWVSFFYIENLSGAPLTFTLRKFVENPSVIAFLVSLNVAFNVLVGVFTNYMSDRVWTRWGRRRPFLIIGWTGVTVSVFFVPLAPNVWWLMATIVCFQFFADIAKPLEALSNEVVPAPQRGRAIVIRNMGQNVMNLFFYGVMVAQFDRTYDLAIWGRSILLRGETLLYWTGSFGLLLAIAFLLFRVRETPPASGIRRDRFAFLPVIRELFGRRQWWTVYLLDLVPMLALPGLSELEPLVRTEQLGFSKADFGWAISAGIVINIAIFIPLAGYLADHVPRLRLLQFGIVSYALLNFGFFLFLRYVAEYSISLPMLVGFAIAATALKSCIYGVWAPLVYDYIPSDRFGTVSAGLAFVAGLFPFLLINLAGLWINGFTRLFGARGHSTFDYSSLYVLQFITTIAAFALTRYVTREERSGRLIAYGRQCDPRAPSAQPEDVLVKL